MSLDDCLYHVYNDHGSNWFSFDVSRNLCVSSPEKKCSPDLRYSDTFLPWAIYSIQHRDSLNTTEFKNTTSVTGPCKSEIYNELSKIPVCQEYTVGES
eukprot:UN28384